ncbi:peptide chain release factor N(5)-glutamine methyltransferase [uncultured Roseovarius sp.]|uniref:peptide chain release factor N(5)-glutamine methyltransferase n=1 Tax=uncultured Roseovarius sp. TaxID=293344 RepID=UPI00261DB081|nr:peptide chain release factor N(5)-glutamine methyltransferase [uncultured Roseovarius sp.]
MRAALADATRALEGAGIEGAGRDARVLLAFALDIPRDRVTLCLEDQLCAAAKSRLDDVIDRRIAREPVSKITGSREFWGRRFEVTADVLDPRPETESLIVAALQRPAATRLLDLGTGSGILAITLLSEWPGATGIATDLSPDALDVAARNANALAVADRLDLVRSDWFQNIRGKFDLIVSNPPYIAAVEMPALSPEVRDFDPEMALSDGADGLSAYREITTGAANHLQPGGCLMVEIGWTQGAQVADFFRAAGFSDVEILPDMGGRDRAVRGFLHG